MRTYGMLLPLLAAGLLAFGPPAAIAEPGDTTALISGAGWHAPDISADGRFVSLFISTDESAAGPAGLRAHVLDRSTGNVELVGDAAAAWELDGDDSPDGNTAISADGRVVAFFTRTIYFDTGASTYAIWVRDRTTGALEKVTEYEQNYTSETSLRLDLSDDGRFVAFDSPRPGLVPGDDDSYTDVFVYDRTTHAFERVSVSSSELGGTGDSYAPALSGDGRYVAFVSKAPNLVASDTNGGRDVFVRDRSSGSTERVSVSSSGAQADIDLTFQWTYPWYPPAISPNGRFVAFTSLATNLVSQDTNGTLDVFVRDRWLGSTERVSVDNEGLQASRDSYGPLSISADGNFVAFRSQAPNLVLGDTNLMPDIFVRDRQAQYTERVNVRSDGVQFLRHFNNVFINPRLTPDGGLVVFEQYNGDAYVHEVGGRKVWAYEVAPSGANFGPQTLYITRTRTFTLQNTGTVDLAVAGIELRGANQSQFRLENRCPGTLEAGTGCTIVVRFVPATVGEMVASLKVRVPIGEDVTVRTRDLSGTGVLAAFSLSPSLLGFGDVTVGNVSSAKSVAVKNTGDGLLPVAKIYLDGANPGQFVITHNCPAQVAKLGSCTVRVAFRPTSNGSKSAQLVVEGGGGAGSRALPLTGRGT